jgi:hypothetical protein
VWYNPVPAHPGAATTKRRLILIALCLLLGVLATGGVAWWCAAAATWNGNWTSIVAPASAADPIRWLWPERAQPESTWGAPTSRWTSRGFGVLGVEVSHEFPVEHSDGVVMMAANRQSTRRAGWPLLALETRDQFPVRHQWKPRYLTKYTWINSIEQGIGIADVKSQNLITLPLTPRWPGFAVDVLLYAGVVFGLASLATGVRRWRRRRGGRCLRCGYELKGVGVCPECGRPVS